MDDPGKQGTPPSDRDCGVRITEHAARGSRAGMAYKLLALILVAGGLGYVLTMGKTPPPETPNAEANVPVADGTGMAAQLPAALPTTAVARPEALPPPVGADGLAGRDLSEFIPAGEAPPMAEVIDQLHKAGIHTGIGAFPPPGTSPPLVGLAVPDDYVLPEGYVRHYQATDDGQRIEPILMYSPDFDFFDASGKPIPIPADRVVPADRAPPGMTVRRNRIPPPLQPGTP